jgi:bacillithiol biosynthesis deacetylase BshB1
MTTPSSEAVDVLAVGAHPDDVEIGCAGTLLALAARGRTFGIVDLTRGESGTRGTPETRADESGEAARILGARFRETLDLKDGNLQRGREAELALVDVIRRRRPRLILAQHVADRHPDHARASGLVEAAWFYAGLSTLVTGQEPHRPQQTVFYLTTLRTTPTFLVNVSSVFETKLDALRAYRSQFYDPSSKEKETFISTRGFFDGISALAQSFGRLANVRFAEGFVSNVPPTLHDAVEAFEGYETGFPP